MSKITGKKLQYTVDVTCGFGDSYEKEFDNEAEAIEFAKNCRDGYATEVFVTELKPVKRRIAKFGNVF